MCRNTVGWPNGKWRGAEGSGRRSLKLFGRVHQGLPRGGGGENEGDVLKAVYDNER